MRFLTPLLAILLLVVTATTAFAQDGEDDRAVLIVLDVSNSMERPGADGTMLLDSARQAVTELVEGIPSEIPVGLRLYGHTVTEESGDTEAGCQDTELVLPVGEADPAAVSSVLDPLEPSGFTPIGTSLEQAGDDVAAYEQATVILVSDGDDNCEPPDPCDVAADLSASGVEVVVDTVGLLLDTAEAEEQLSCIAEATDGTFVTADDTASLTAALQESSTRAERRYEVSGEPVEGAAVPFEAPELEPGVQYVDEVRGDETLFYAIADLESGDTFDVEIVREGTPGREGSSFVYTYLVDRDNNELGYTTCCSSEILDTADVTALRDVELPEDTEQGFLRVDMDVSRADPAQLQRLQLRVVPTGATASAAPATDAPTATGEASPTPEPTTADATAGPTDGSAGATDAPASTAPDAPATPVASTTEAGGGVPGWLYVVLGLGGLAFLGMGGWIVALQRRVGSQSAPGRSERPPPRQQG